MAQVTESVDVDVPVSIAYDRWTRFDTFPQFLDFVESITQTDDTHTHWKINIGGAEREFDAVTTEQNKDERVAWKSTGGDENQAGVVTFHRLSDNQSRVTVQLDWQPTGAVETIGAAVGVDDHAIKRDLVNFKNLIEGRSSSS